MPFSHCYNCGNPKNPPYTDFYCDECEQIRVKARSNATQNNLNPSEEARKALSTRAFNPKMNRMPPNMPYTNYDATMNTLNSRREGA
jgi:recombinational DNA repair protein (RecF pathway)